MLSAGVGLSLFSRSEMTGSARKDLRCGRIPVCLEVGLYSLIRERRKEKAPLGSKTVGILDMVVV